jgi:DNA-directed RNA polymerase specialized sigma24 family protein
LANFVLVNKFSNISKYDRENVKQEMVIKIWELIQRKEIDKNSNIFSYIIGRYIFILRDYIRKANRRKKIAEIVYLNPNLT